MAFLNDECPVDFSFDDVVKDSKEKKISYTGEELSQPLPLSKAQIEAGLPPPGHGGSVPLLPFLVGRTRYLIENPSETLLPPCDRGAAPCQARVRIQAGGELEVFELLRERGVINWFPDDQVFSDERGKYLSGFFGVVKPG